MRYFPKLQQLQAFQAVILHGSIRAAAKALDQSQPGLTRSLQELEQTLGTALVIRGGSGVIPTDAGRLFSTRIELVLNELDRALNEIEHHNHSTSGAVMVGLSSLPILTIFPGALKRFRRRYKQSTVTNIEGQISNLLPNLRNGELDFIICADIPSDYLSGLVQEPLFSTSCHIYAREGHPLANCTSLAELQDADWFLPVSSIGQYSQLEQLIFKSSDHQRKAIMRGTATAALQMTMNADYLTIAARELIRTHFLNQKFCIIPVKETLPKVEFWLIYSSERPLTMAAKNLMDEFRWESQHYSWE